MEARLTVLAAELFREDVARAEDAPPWRAIVPEGAPSSVYYW